jgi:hypothetical protein
MIASYRDHVLEKLNGKETPWNDDCMVLRLLATVCMIWKLYCIKSEVFCMHHLENV